MKLDGATVCRRCGVVVVSQARQGELVFALFGWLSAVANLDLRGGAVVEFRTL